MRLLGISAASSMALMSCGSSMDTLPHASFSQASNSSNTLVSLFDGQPIRSTSIVTRQNTVSGGTTLLSDDTTYSYDSDSQILMVRMGDTVRSFDLSGNNSDFIVQTDGAYSNNGVPFYGFFVQGGDLNEFVTGSGSYKYLIPIRSYTSSDDDRYTDRSFGVAGLETPVSQMPRTNAVVNYTGGFQVENFTKGSPDLNARTAYFGALSLDTNFGNGLISNGLLTVNIQNINNTGNVSANGTFDLAPTVLSGNGFTTTISSNVPGLSINPGSEVTGKFFGDIAQEVGGTIFYEGDLFGTAVISPGFFSATQ